MDERKATEILIMTQADIDQDRDLRNDKIHNTILLRSKVKLKSC